MNQKNVLSEMPQRNPINGTFELTVRCNLKCKMCLFRHDDSENAEIMEKELTTEQWIDMARQVADAGTMTLLITGGEPMLRPDFCEIWEGIYKQGFLISIYTNATLVDSKIIETLRKYPPHKIGITIYGASADTYEEVCGSKGAFQKMFNGVKSLLTLPSLIEFRTTIIQDNQKDIVNIHRMIRDYFGEEYGLVLSSEVHKAVRGACADVDKCRLSPNQMIVVQETHMREKVRAITKDSLNVDKLKFEYTSMKDRSECKTDRLSFFGCLAGMDRYVISWDGKLLACQMLGVFYTNPIVSGFSKAWEEYPYKVDIPLSNSKCQNCDVEKYCQSCFASRYAESGELNGCSDYIYTNACNKKEIIKL